MQRYLNLRQAAALPQLEGTGITITTLRTAAKRCELKSIFTMRKILTTETWLEEWLTSCHAAKAPGPSGKTEAKKANPASGSSEMDRLSAARASLTHLESRRPKSKR